MKNYGIDGIEYINSETDLENAIVGVDENGKDITGIRLYRWIFNWIIETKQELETCRDANTQKKKEIIQLKDKLSKMNEWINKNKTA